MKQNSEINLDYNTFLCVIFIKAIGSYCFIRTDRICSGLITSTKSSVQMTDRNFWFSETLQGRQSIGGYQMTLSKYKARAAVHVFVLIYVGFHLFCIVR